MPRFRNRIDIALLILLGGLTAWLGCDSSITGDPFVNEAPSTSLSVRDTSLVENLAPRRLTSTIFASWSGTDPDGFVSFFEVRYYDEGDQVGFEEGWFPTPSLDSLILLPIKESNSTANVVFEVRAVDNEGLRDPTPARTVYPIVNSPPTIRFSTFELPPDTTFSIVSFSWIADDPEGVQNLDRIEVSFNDTTSFVSLPAETEFATFVADLTSSDRVGNVTPARVYLGRGFEATSIFVPGLRLDDGNLFSVRAVDKTDTASVRLDFEVYLWEPKGDILLVNDYRKSSAPVVEEFHYDLLTSYLPEGTPVDVWNISQPYFTGNTGILTRSDYMPPVADPTVRQFLALYDHIYWVATNTTTVPRANNFPFAATVIDLFFEQGGTLMMHSPVGLPANEEEIESNPAILVLPISGFVSFPDSLRPSLRLAGTALISPTGSMDLPVLTPTRLMIGTLPYVAEGTDVSLYTAEYTTQPFSGPTGPWTGPSTVASISSDDRVALFALPILDDRNGDPLLVGAEDDSPETTRDAMFRLLETLGFPRR